MRRDVTVDDEEQKEPGVLRRLLRAISADFIYYSYAWARWKLCRHRELAIESLSFLKENLDDAIDGTLKI